MLASTLLLFDGLTVLFRGSEFSAREHKLRISEEICRHEEPHTHTQRFQLCSNPFSADVNILENVFSQESHPEAEMELIEIQSSTALKLLHKECNYESFWKSADTRKFPLIRHEALKVLHLFGITYTCEAAFSFI